MRGEGSGAHARWACHIVVGGQSAACILRGFRKSDPREAPCHQITTPLLHGASNYRDAPIHGTDRPPARDDLCIAQVHNCRTALETAMLVAVTSSSGARRRARKEACMDNGNTHDLA